jgi:hypothetical protein
MNKEEDTADISFYNWYNSYIKMHSRDEIMPTMYEAMLNAWVAGAKYGIEHMKYKAIELLHTDGKSD